MDNLGNAVFTAHANTDPLVQGMEKAQQSTQAAAGAIQGSLTGASYSAGRSLSQLAYAIDDVQYGFNAIVNNIPQIALGLGMGAGIAGVAGIAAVAVNQLYKHWGELTSALQAAWEGGSADRLKVLADRAEKAAESFEKLKSASTDAEGKGAKVLGEAIVEAGTEKTRKALTDTLLATGGGAALPAFESEKERDARMRAQGMGGAAGGGGISEKEARAAQYAATAKMAAEL